MKPVSPGWLACPARDGDVALRILLLALVWCLLLVANPGFFSHDELQKLDHVVRYGFADYLQMYVRLYQGAEFGQPVRPFSFLVQGLVSLALPEYPVVPHLVDVLSHGVIAVLLFRAIAELQAPRQFAWVAALVFVCSPLATFSVGWPAALMDRFYIFFGLLAFIAAARFVRGAAGGLALAGVVLASALAMLSKETAAVLPGVLAVFLVFPLAVPVRHKRLLAAFVAWSLPVALFMAYRAAALAGSLAAPSSGTYGMSVSHLADGLVVYGLYPFLPFLAEAGVWKTQSGPVLALAGAAHLLLVLLLWRSFSARVAGLYVLGYYAFLAPVLFISAKGSHYLYGSGVAFSMAVAALIVLSPHRTSLWNRGAATGLVTLAAAHVAISQLFIYGIGSCMNSAAISLESAYLAGGRPADMKIAIADGARGHILHRLVTGREQVGAHYPVRFAVVDDGAADYVFNAACIVYRK